MKKIKEYNWIGRTPGVRRGRGRPAMYDYDKLFDGVTTILVQGEDYDCSEKSMRGTLYAAAKKRGLTIRVKTTKGAVTVQCPVPEDE